MITQVAVILPIILPLATMAMLLLAWKSVAAQKVVGVIGSTLLMASAAALLWLVNRDVSEDRRTLYVHAMFVDSPDEVRDSIKNGFERRLLELMR